MANVPKLRFEGYTDAWEQRKLGDMLDRYEDPVETPHDGYERIGIRSHAKGVFHSYVEPGKELDTAKMHRVAADKFILNITFAWEHAVAITEEEDAGTLVSHRFPQFSFHQDLKSHFFKFLMLDRRFKEFLELCSPGGAGRNRVLNINDMLKYKIIIPNTDEQINIAAFFDNIDILITLHQRKCEALSNAKKFYLQNMFPQEGETKPRLRFEGFTDAWEQRKYSELAELRRGLTYKPSDICEDGVRVLRSSNINEDSFVMGKDDVFVKKEAINIPYAQSGDILITSANGSSRLVGKHTIINGIPDNSTVHGGFMLLASAKNPQFVNALMSSSWYTKFINTYVAGGNGAIGNLSKGDLDEQIVWVPSEAEQYRIGGFFEMLDETIILHQHKCEALKSLKKFMLQNMFPRED